MLTVWWIQVPIPHRPVLYKQAPVQKGWLYKIYDKITYAFRGYSMYLFLLCCWNFHENTEGSRTLRISSRRCSGRPCRNPRRSTCNLEPGSEGCYYKLAKELLHHSYQNKMILRLGRMGHDAPRVRGTSRGDRSCWVHHRPSRTWPSSVLLIDSASEYEWYIW